MKTPTKSHLVCRFLASGWLALASPMLFGATATSDLPYDSGSTGADGPLTFPTIPLGRRGAMAAYDSNHHQGVVFGGYNNNVGYLADTWLWDGTNWTQMVTTNNPSARSSPAMIYDAARKQIVLFGGYNNNKLGETWLWNGTTWTKANPVHSPSPRYNSAMTYDAAHQQVVLFGGYDNNTGDLGETWLWNGSDWSLATTVNNPSARNAHAMAYDAAHQQVVLFGGDRNSHETWLWDGTNWTQASPATFPPDRAFPAMTFDAVHNLVVLFGGDGNFPGTWLWNGTNWSQLNPTGAPGNYRYHSLFFDELLHKVVLFGGDLINIDGSDAETWLWDGSAWAFWSGKVQYFDMTARANGIWNFTTIDVPNLVTVRFIKNAGNTPVRWLANNFVNINGVVDLSGDYGANTIPQGLGAQGGPGGFAGGHGAYRLDQSGSYVGGPGQGPGGGAPGVNKRDNGADGQYASSYGNAYLQPLVGGSGGGGGASDDTVNGGNGGGGGGAILIASSRDIAVNGKISANGAASQYGGASYGGAGSGGAILLRADRVSGSGSLEAFSNYLNNQSGQGRIRLEAYFRSLAGSTFPVSVNSAPVSNKDFNAVGTLAITSVAGSNVAQPPSGNTFTPDVVFTAAGNVAITVSATGIPDTTPVNLRITTSSSVINVPPVNLANGTASFSVTVPKGIGTIQAFANFTLSN